MAGNRIHETLLARANSEPLAHPAVYPGLFERVTSDPSQSRRRGPHLAEHENIKAEVVLPAARARTVPQEYRDACAEEAARMRRMVMARSRMRARRIESVQGGRNWDDDELAQCLSRPLGSVIPFIMRVALPTKAVSPKYLSFASSAKFSHKDCTAQQETKAYLQICTARVTGVYQVSSSPPPSLPSLLRATHGGLFRPFSISVMLRDKAKSGGSTKQGKVKAVALEDSPTRVAPLTSAKDPPPYGAQHRQDALWEDVGGNEALPPRWRQLEAGGVTWYQDDNLIMVSWNRPLPGVRLGRSYFVNHNTRITSWKKPVPDRPVGSLTPECIIE
ncbi:hypothetical protein M405DRAFT_886480, partial [Rhizopogon salebrosus TDB-379]